MKNSSIRLLSENGTEHIISCKMARQSILLRCLIDETEISEEGVPLPVSSEILEKIIEFLLSHEEDKELPMEYDPFDPLPTDFDRIFLQTNQKILFQIAKAANYLHIPLLLELCCKTIAETLKEKTTEEIREYLAIEQEHTNTSAAKEYGWIE
ncbi:S-phase kinase-associated protein 1 [Nematocida sp. LUAm3]|nr:S-phase kinase-associated protein 1 [Nematocida sp. LUAm3]KAI5175468.1 S-phase kinase-associated protein 1 [Nematocida sp. LUAm2]KAI5178502.1 S-phase kinase-associated protein 1 [Nematocida sp. LUAm1]